MSVRMSVVTCVLAALPFPHARLVPRTTHDSAMSRRVRVLRGASNDVRRMDPRRGFDRQPCLPMGRVRSHRVHGHLEDYCHGARDPRSSARTPRISGGNRVFAGLSSLSHTQHERHEWSLFGVRVVADDPLEGRTVEVRPIEPDIRQVCLPVGTARVDVGEPDAAQVSVA